MGVTLALLTGFAAVSIAQQPPARQGGPPGQGAPQGAARSPMTIQPDPRTQQRSYDFKDTGEKLSYVQWHLLIDLSVINDN